MPRSGSFYYSQHPVGEIDLPALVLIHGAGGSSETWPRQLRRTPGYRVFSVDLPAHGKSNGSAENSIRGYATHLLEWMQATNIGRAVLVGHSMGAAIALVMALEAPHRAEQLILLGAAARFLVNPVLLEKLAVPRHTQAAVNMIVTWSFAKATEQHLRQAYSRQLMANKPGVLRHDFLSCADFDLRARVKEISRPTLILCGQEDVMVPVSRSRELGTQLMRSTLQEVKGAGHMLMQEKPAEVASLIEQQIGPDR